MYKYAFLADPARKGSEIAEDSGRVATANAKHWEPRAYQGVNRYRSLLEDKSFSLTIKADDGSTLLKTRVEYLVGMFAQLSLDQMGFTATTKSRLYQTLVG
ncbi:MAG: hypothetical protein WB586_05670 [Chthoniobacterales bacterium]